MSSDLMLTMAVLFVVLLAGRIMYARQIKRMRRGKEILDRFDRDHDSRPLGL